MQFYILCYFYLHSYDIYSFYVRDEIVSHVLISTACKLTFVANSVLYGFL